MPAIPEAVVFDIGNVLINWDPRLLYDQLLPDRAAQNLLFATADLDGMNRAIDLGAPFRETVYATADRHPEYSDLIRQWHDRWIEMAGPGIPQTWALLRALRTKEIPVFALSNFGIDSLVVAESVYPVLKEFDRRFISGHLGVIKPDVRIYQIVEQESGLSGDQLLFIDDRSENIAAAVKRGWQGYVFKEPQHLARALVAHDLLNATDIRASGR